MVAFSEKQLEDRSIGETLRKKRVERGETLKDVEEATRIVVKHLEALERNAFDRLPEAVYTRHFVRNLADHYGLDPTPLVNAVMREYAVTTGPAVPRRMPTSSLAGRRLTATPRTIKAGLLGLTFLGIITYFGIAVHAILTPPKLIVHTPEDSQVFENELVRLEGVTEPEVELTVNQESVLIEDDGSFHETLTLPEGVSVLRIAAKKKHSKAQEVYIKVVIAPDKSEEAEEEGAGNSVAKK